MRHALTKEHLDFFYQNHFITFEEVISQKECAALNAALEEQIGNENDPEKIFEKGHNTWRKDPRIKKVVLSSRLAEIATQLSKERTLRIGSDQILVPKLPIEPAPIIDLCSVQKVVAGLTLSPFTGNATFYKPNEPIPFEEISEVELLIIYSEHHALYTHTPTDRHTHSLKKDGYGFGDHIDPKTHPIITRC